MMKRLVPLLAVLVFAASGSGHAATKTYGPGNYKAGPQGGDDRNVFMSDPASGQVTVIRANPEYSAFDCHGLGGFASLQLTHVAKSAVRSLTVSYSNGLFDSFTWVKLWVIKNGRFVASRSVRGPAAGDGVIRVGRLGGAGTYLIRFGLEVASACPNIDGGTVTFSSVSVTS